MPTVYLKKISDPKNSGVDTPGLMFHYDEPMKEHVKQQGFWWSAPDLCWYIPSKKIGVAAVQMFMLELLLGHMVAARWEISDSGGVLAWLRDRIANGPTQNLREIQSAYNAHRDFTVAFLQTRQQADATRQRATTAQHDQEQAARNRSTDFRILNALLGENRVAPTSAQVRPANRAGNLNQRVNQRVEAARAIAGPRDNAQIRAGATGRNQARVPAPVPVPVPQITAVGLQMPVHVQHAGQTLIINQERWEAFVAAQAEMECPLKNSVHAEYVELWRELQGLLWARELRDDSYARLKAGEFTSKEVYVRFPFWQNRNLARIPELMEEFEAMSRALESSTKVLKHAAKGCSSCRK